MVDIDPDGVRNVGNELFPTLADIYQAVGEKVDSASGLTISSQGSLQSSLVEYLRKLSSFLVTSETRLRDCGDILVDVADNLQKVDEDNAESIANPL